jgi:hypothetical protein
LKVNYQENVGAAKTDAMTALNGLKELLSRDLPATATDLARLGPMKAPDPHEFMRKPGVVQDPKGEIADIHSDLKWILKTLADAEVLIKENRALVTELLK